MTGEKTMRLLLLRIVLAVITQTSLAQEGYNYPQPSKPLIPGINSNDIAGKPRDMFKPSPTHGQPSSNNNSPGFPGPMASSPTPGYPGQSNGYPLSRPDPNYTNGRQPEVQQPGGRDNNGYNGQNVFSGYPKDRPSVPFFDGKTATTPPIGMIPSPRPSGPGTPNRQFPTMPGSKPQLQGPSTGYPSGSPVGQIPKEGLPSPGQTYLSPTQRPGTVQSPGRTDLSTYDGKRPAPFPGDGQRTTDAPAPQGMFGGYPGKSPGSNDRPGSQFGGYPGKSPSSNERPGSQFGGYPGKSPSSNERPGSQFGGYPDKTPSSNERPGSQFGGYPGKSPSSNERPGSQFGGYPSKSPSSNERPGSQFGGYPDKTPSSNERPGSQFGGYPDKTPSSNERPGSQFGGYPSKTPSSNERPGSQFGGYPSKTPSSNERPGSQFGGYPSKSPSSNERPGSQFGGYPDKTPSSNERPGSQFGGYPDKTPSSNERPGSQFGGYPSKSPSSNERPGSQFGQYPSGNGYKPTDGTSSQKQPSGYNGPANGGIKPQPIGGYNNKEPDRQGMQDRFFGQGETSQRPKQDGYFPSSQRPQDTSRPMNTLDTGDSRKFSGTDGSFDDTKNYSHDDGQYDGDYSAIPGVPGRDYPIYSEIPSTNFRCDQQQFPGYYADVEAQCQVFHICANNKTYDFLCPNGTIFHQQFFVCVWWNQFDCNTASNFYYLNENLYDYTIMGSQGMPGQTFQDQRGPTAFQGPNRNTVTSPQTPYPKQEQGIPSNGYPKPEDQGKSIYDGKSQQPKSQYMPTRYPSNRPDGPMEPYSPSTRPNVQTNFDKPSTLPSSTYRQPQQTQKPQGPQRPGDSSGYPQGNGLPRDYSTPSFGSSDKPQTSPMSRVPGGSSNYPGSSPGYFTDRPRGPPDSRQPISSHDKSESSGPSRYPNGDIPTSRPTFDPSRPTGVPGSSKPNREYLPPRNE